MVPGLSHRNQSASRKLGTGPVGRISPVLGPPAGLLCLLIVASALNAQVIDGQLLEARTGRPIPEAFVTLMDLRGGARAAALTDSVGGFSLRAPRPGRYRIRVERIGYKSQSSPPLKLGPDERQEVRIAVPVEAIELEALQVEAERQCVNDPQDALSTASLWTAARTALATNVWHDQHQALEFEVNTFTRWLHPRELYVEEEQVWTKSVLTGRPFASLPAEELSRKGYVSARGDSSTYYAPDAEVLLSDAFLKDHCFGVVRDLNGVGLIGLTFEPVPEREVADIRGALWLDARTAELRHIEYTYTGFAEELTPEMLGGRIEFQRLRTGAWIIRRWWIRAPVYGETKFTSTNFVQISPWKVLFAVREEGGEVTRVFTQDGLALSDDDW